MPSLRYWRMPILYCVFRVKYNTLQIKFTCKYLLFRIIRINYIFNKFANVLYFI